MGKSYCYRGHRCIINCFLNLHVSKRIAVILVHFVDRIKITPLRFSNFVLYSLFKLTDGFTLILLVLLQCNMLQ